MSASRVVVVLAVVVLGIVVSQPRAVEPTPSTWTAIDPVSGERVPLFDRGRLLHVVFFATWCPPCTEELPYLADLDARWGEDGYRLVLLAVSTRQDRDRLRRFVERRRVPGRLLYDVRDDVRRLLDVDELPTHVILDENGEELFRGPTLAEGVADRVEQEMRRPR